AASGCTSTARPRPDMGAPAPPPTSVRIIGTVTIADDLLARRMDALAARSATWRAGMDSIQAAGFHMVVAGPAAVRRMVRGLENYAPEHLGEVVPLRDPTGAIAGAVVRSEEHTSELQSRENLVCRLLLEKKKKKSTRSN